MFSKKSEYFPATNDDNLHEENVSRGIEVKKNKKIVKEESDLENVEKGSKNKDQSRILLKLKKNKRPIALVVSLLLLVSFIIFLSVVIKSRNETTKKEFESHHIINSSKSEPNDLVQQSLESADDIVNLK